MMKTIPKQSHSATVSTGYSKTARFLPSAAISTITSLQGSSIPSMFPITAIACAGNSGWDFRSAARAGLMHDLYFFENTSVDENGQKLLKNHPFRALENSERIFELNEIEKDAIVNHMWPCISLSRPRFKESMVVSFSDKFCAVIEATLGASLFAARKSSAAANSIASGISDAYVQTKETSLYMLRSIRGTAANVIRLACSFII